MNYAIIGTGAIGGYYGGLLAKSGHEVHFLLHRDYEYVRDHGLQVNSCDGSYHVDVNAYNTTSLMPKCDVVLVCLKTIANGQLLEMLPPLLHEHTIVVLIQNGIGVEEDVQRMVPQAQIAAGLAFICTIKSAPGVIDHLSNGRLTIGGYSCRSAEAVNAIVDDMTAAGIRAFAADYLTSRWKKAVWNMPFNGMTTVMNTDAGSLLRNKATYGLIYRMMLEVIGGAKACGVEDIDEGYADKMIDMTLKMPPYSSSMQIDRERRHPMEIEYLYSRPIAEAKAHGFDMPLLGMLEAQLKFL